MKHTCIVILLCLFSQAAFAQAKSFNGTASGTISVFSVMSLNFTNLTGVISFNTPDDYFSGITMNNAATISVKSNVNWQLSVSAQSAFFMPMSQGASTDMPASVLGIRRNGTTTYMQMNTASQTLKTGNKGAATATGNTFDIDTRINPGFGYSGGSYNIGVLFTLSQQ
ncbi:hypothetical protein CAP35_10900 [Chitinophagaceae bacterium IBVUCB1]|nr:hypothetical protein CAP35_10900 [Chitinophagaceae bacterium IBVUCB1]